MILCNNFLNIEIYSIFLLRPQKIKIYAINNKKYDVSYMHYSIKYILI